MSVSMADLYNVANGSEGRVKEAHGRWFQDTNELYNLPTDILEHGRLGLQGTALFLALEGNYPSREAVRAALAHRTDRRPVVLDIGTGPGSWAESMAREFPHSDVLGFDLVLPQTKVAPPRNVRYIQGDINDGLPDWHGKVDVVHSRCMTPGILSVDFFIKELGRLLRPGGVMIFADGDLQLYDDGSALSDAPDTTAIHLAPNAGQPQALSTPEIFPILDIPNLLERAPKPLARDSCAMQKLFSIMRDVLIEDRGEYGKIFSAPEILEKTGIWTDIGKQSVFIPVGVWANAGVDARTVVMSSVLGRDAVMVFSAMKLSLMKKLPEEEVDRLIQAAVDEGNRLTFRANSVWHYVWAVRTEDPPVPPSARM